ncbi:MAG: aminotransferase class I/II-fold pyridoxal phosphate-dependent enzyme [Anaerolineales bacterium]|nr:aminotransferase class I/II-fold pyridoxal phosphate-dependent enzyme [Anaerolineales bacterium]
MQRFSREHGMSTIVNQACERTDPLNAHIMPIYQTSLFRFPDFASAEAIYSGDQDGFTYTRTDNPNVKQLGDKYALLEGLDLLRAAPDERPEDVIAGLVFASGMAAITSGILARVHEGESILAQRSLYSGTFGFFDEIAPRLGIRVIWVDETSSAGWEAALAERSDVRLVYVETPANPVMDIVDIEIVADLAHQHGCWLAVDNTFATPYAQRPLTLGADVVFHSTTKYLSGHGVIIGGVVVSRHTDFVNEELLLMRKRFGGAASPFDAWLANLGLRTLELRMEKHCSNAQAIANFLVSHPKVEVVHYPGLETHPGYEIARKQMHAFGGMISFELKGGFEAAQKMLDAVQVMTLGVSLGNVDTLIQHPAGMTHVQVPPEARREMGISDSMVRLSVGVENVEDLITDLGQALEVV